MAVSNEHSASVWAFRNHFHDLTLVIKHQLSSFNAIVYAEFLIGEETKEKGNADATLSEIESCLRNDASVFKRFIDALSMTSRTTSVDKVIADLELSRVWYLRNCKPPSTATKQPKDEEDEGSLVLPAPFEQESPDSTVNLVTGAPQAPAAVAPSLTNTTQTSSPLPTAKHLPTRSPSVPVQVQQKPENFQSRSEPTPVSYLDIHCQMRDAVDSLNKGLYFSVYQNQDLERTLADQDRIIAHTTNQLRTEKQIRKEKEAEIVELTEKLRQVTVEANALRAYNAELAEDNLKLTQENFSLIKKTVPEKRHHSSAPSLVELGNEYRAAAASGQFDHHQYIL